MDIEEDSILDCEEDWIDIEDEEFIAVVVSESFKIDEIYPNNKKINLIILLKPYTIKQKKNIILLKPYTIKQ